MVGDLSHDVDALRRVPLFARVPTAKLKLLAFACERLSFAAGERLFEQGDYGDDAYVILRGAVDVSVTVDGLTFQVARLIEHDVVGEMAILSDAPRSAAATATGSLEALRIDRRTFFDLLETSHEMAIEMLRVLARRLAKTTLELSVAKAQALRRE